MGGMIDKTYVYEAAYILARKLLYGQSIHFLFFFMISDTKIA